MNDAVLNVTQEWDKVFPQSDKVRHRKVTFHNRFGITLAADLYDRMDVIPFDKITAFYKTYLR